MSAITAYLTPWHQVAIPENKPTGNVKWTYIAIIIKIKKIINLKMSGRGYGKV